MCSNSAGLHLTSNSFQSFLSNTVCFPVTQHTHKPRTAMKNLASLIFPPVQMCHIKLHHHVRASLSQRCLTPSQSSTFSGVRRSYDCCCGSLLPTIQFVGVSSAVRHLKLFGFRLVLSFFSGKYVTTQQLDTVFQVDFQGSLQKM